MEQHRDARLEKETPRSGHISAYQNHSVPQIWYVRVKTKSGTLAGSYHSTRHAIAVDGLYGDLLEAAIFHRPHLHFCALCDHALCQKTAQYLHRVCSLEVFIDLELRGFLEGIQMLTTCKRGPKYTRNVYILNKHSGYVIYY